MYKSFLLRYTLYKIHNTKMLFFRKNLRIVWIAVLAMVVFVLIWLAIIPSGKTSYSTNFKGFNDFISQLTPKERVAAEKNGTQDIFSDPAYFSLRTPRTFDKGLMTIKFQVTSSTPIVEAGVSKDGRTWQYDLQPLYNAKLENLLKNWSVLWEGDVMLLQRTKQFNTINDFLKNPPATEKIALYNYNLKANYSLPGYQPRHATSTLCRPLVGAYQFYTYIKNENLSDDFVFQDLNNLTGPSPIDVYVYAGDKLVGSRQLADDGIIDGSSGQKPWRHLQINLANLPEGVYKIDVRANGDIITRTITTVQGKMAFINNLPLADTPEVSCGKTFFTDGRSLSVKTSHPAKLGVIKIISSSTEQDLNVNEAYQIFTVADLPSSGSRIILANDGVAISGDGLFSLDAESMIDPRIASVDVNFNADKEGIDYVLARYTPPTRQGGWLSAQVNFDLKNSFRLWNKYYFIISAPGLSTSSEVKIENIKFDLSGTSLWEKILKK
jgi:hypothetical protein